MASIIQATSAEPNHTPGHSTAVVAVSEKSFMCPECGKLFTVKDAVEIHLHGVHLEHLRSEHKDQHGNDVVGHHVE